jgi:hypothetical protein
MKLSMSSAALGAALAAAPLLVVRVGVVGPVEVPGMPAASSMVRGTFDGTLALGETADLYTVPPGYWLVLTSVHLSGAWDTAYDCSLYELQPGGGTISIHGGQGFYQGSVPVPVALGPGSVMRLERFASNSGPEGVEWVGYLERR